MFPATTVQTCIVHLIRNSLKYVPRREFADVARDLNRSTPRLTPMPPTKSSSALMRNGVSGFR